MHFSHFTMLWPPHATHDVHAPDVHAASIPSLAWSGLAWPGLTWPGLSSLSSHFTCTSSSSDSLRRHQLVDASYVRLGSHYILL